MICFFEFLIALTSVSYNFLNSNLFFQKQINDF
jgi:hypothetical protein